MVVCSESFDPDIRIAKTMSPFDEIILSRSLPEVMDLIFVRHLAHRDLLSCLRVSGRWREALRAHLLRPGARCLSDHLAFKWTEFECECRHVGMENEEQEGMSICYSDLGKSDVLVMLSRHGRKEISLVRLDRESLKVLNKRKVMLESPLSAVASCQQLLVCQLANKSAFVADRNTLSIVKVEGGVRGRRMTSHRGDVYNLMLRSRGFQDVVVTRMESGRMRHCATVERRECRWCPVAGEGGGAFSHAFGGGEGGGDAVVAVGCPHGYVTLHDVVNGKFGLTAAVETRTRRITRTTTRPQTHNKSSSSNNNNNNNNKSSISNNNKSSCSNSSNSNNNNNNNNNSSSSNNNK